MMKELSNLRSEALQLISIATTESELNMLRTRYLGKKSLLSSAMSSLKSLSNEEKREIGPLINSIKRDLQEALQVKANEIVSATSFDFDLTMPIDTEKGSLHPITIVANDVCKILTRLGFFIVSGPEIESEYYNFDALNVPKFHPARDMQDTYWLNNNMLLRTHTSPCQVRAMETYGAPLRIVAPGRCFRNENVEAAHENTFFQLEGMVIDKSVSISNLLYVMKGILSEIFGRNVIVRLRPGYFPFVEPGFELDIACLICNGDGCPTCKNSGWVELCPCGMIHPNVLKASGIDPEQYSGFAFGIGLTRLAMMKYHIPDIRIFNTCDLRHLNQFNIV